MSREGTGRTTTYPHSHGTSGSEPCPRLEALPHACCPAACCSRAPSGGRARLLGLAALDALPRHWALHLPRCRSVHTFGMRFALDLVWLDGDGRPLRVDRGVGPRRLRSCVRARSVVEVAAGAADGVLAAWPPALG